MKNTRLYRQKSTGRGVRLENQNQRRKKTGERTDPEHSQGSKQTCFVNYKLTKTSLAYFLCHSLF